MLLKEFLVCKDLWTGHAFVDDTVGVIQYLLFVFLHKLKTSVIIKNIKNVSQN